MRNRPTRLILTAVAAGVLAVGAPTVALASVTAPTAPAAAPAATPAAPSESQWKQLDHLATTPSVLGVADSGTVLRLAAGTPDAVKAKVENLLPADARTTVQTSRFSKDTLDTIQTKVTDRTWNDDADRYGVATAYDAASDKVTVYTDAPDSVTKSLTSAYPGAVEVQQARLEPQQSRFADAQPFWAGAALIGTEGTQAYKCTAGFAVKQHATGHLYLTTAGHCYGNLTHVYSRGQNNGFGNWVGQVTRRDQNIDTELMSGNTAKPYDSFMFTGGLAGSGASMFVHGTELPDNGTKVCVSGSVSFNHCGHPISNSRFSICYSGGANCIRDGKGFVYNQGGTNWPAYDNGQLTQPGDSGAPIYTTDDTESGAWIVGGHSGVVWQAESPCHCSREHMVGVNIAAITQDLGVDVVTR
ncbi:hypothetical protein [Streptomyces acidiscabies]|uniref:Alpha-lytic protease n=1 Tax=Streptomyces acidiscabies TaxID=42234 RepID=A0AAP6BGW4_9ACTN|nr:hypothetical protein [Streptomyces acidiscabies]MBZ3913867.1 hypothetical protein [Streptomyces acidiscabies]MDX2964494.1 hypothetical protein [Streptomyces acidiscabies]MDX3022042.1 hypothetical protein [Streptomyces acidiscabies]MDX3793606.1 hypothetical protein [Streptomyces acidiscabies]GAV37589.1 hypothetical protein Saa2_00463 [Streptomyces acidiscabies]